jgi:hypothetical protein
VNRYTYVQIEKSHIPTPENLSVIENGTTFDIMDEDGITSIDYPVYRVSDRTMRIQARDCEIPDDGSSVTINDSLTFAVISEDNEVITL